jgi:hypothetical protein
MTATKEKAARPGRVKAAHTTTSEPNDSTRRELVAVIDKNVGEELQVRINEFRGNCYVDLRLFANYAGKRVPTTKGLTLSLDMLPELRDALLAAELRATAVATNKA